MTTQRSPLMDISSNDVTSSPVGNGNRRKSGRAVRAPEKFVPEATPVQPTSAKRKRGEDVENDASDVDEDAEASDATIESAGEEEDADSRRKSKSKKTRKPANKKPKVNGAVEHEEALALKLPNRSKKLATKKVAIADQDASGLYAEVYSSGQSSEDVASQWLSRYAADPPAAMTELINLVLRSSGCTIEVTQDDINDSDNAEGKLADLQDEYQAQNITDYPLISKAKSSHAFRQSLVGFFDQLIEAMHQSGAMYEQTATIETIHIWVATLSSSTSRPFRHTATLVALTVTSAMCRVASEQIETGANIQRQLEGEKKHKRGNKARLADFQKKVATNDEHKTFIESQIKDFFDTVYVHRYRDVDPRIRIECVEALGNWILTLESVFFEGTYLRYMGWMLSDTHGAMRHEVIKQLLEIMSSLNHGGMRHFIERFRPRLIEMATRDSESSVRISAVELMQSIRQAGFLEPDDIDIIGKLIFDAEPKVRKALVGFFAENIQDSYDGRIEELGGEEALEGLLNVDDEEDYDIPRASWIRYKCLAESLSSYDSEDQEEMPSQIEVDNFLNMSGSESRFSLAAQALFDQITDLKEWEQLAGYLLFDHTSRATGNQTERGLRESFKPNDKEELILLDILNAVVKLSLSHADDSDKSGRKKPNRTEILEARQNAARRLAGLIPRLLKKFGADPKTATVVLRLEHVLNLGVFEELRQDSTVYAKLLDEISTQFNGHADKGVLSEAGAALLHARGYEELEEVTEPKLQSLWEDVTGSLRKINKSGTISVRGALKAKVLTELSHTLARLDQLSSISSSVEALETSTGKAAVLPINILLDIIARGVFEDSDDEALIMLEDEVVQSAIRSAMFYFMWKTRALGQAIQSGEDISALDIEHLKEWQEIFTTNLISAFSSRATLDAVRLLGSGTLLDFYVLFATLRPAKKSKGELNSDGSASLQELVAEIDPEVQAELVSIFDGLEKQFAKKAKRKLAEPGDDDAPVDLDSEPEDDEEDEDVTDNERQAETLKAEKQLCELTGKLVLAILAQVLDASGPLKGKLRLRLQRNRQKLGPSFKEVVAYLDDPKSKSKKSHKSKAQQAADTKKKAPKSTELVEEDQEEDPFAEIEPEEGTVEDLRRRELLEDPIDSDGDDENGDTAGVPEADDNIMGD